MKDVWNIFKALFILLTVLFIVVYLKDHPVEEPLRTLGESIYLYLVKLLK